MHLKFKKWDFSLCHLAKLREIRAELQKDAAVSAVSLRYCCKIYLNTASLINLAHTQSVQDFKGTGFLKIYLTAGKTEVKGEEGREKKNRLLGKQAVRWSGLIKKCDTVTSITITAIIFMPHFLLLNYYQKLNFLTIMYCNNIWISVNTDLYFRSKEPNPHLSGVPAGARHDHHWRTEMY